MFNLQNQFEFNAIVKFVEQRVNLLRKQNISFSEDQEIANGA